MAKDVIARLKADTSQWDTNINKALGGLQDLAKNTMSVDNIIGNGIRTLTKYAAVWLSVEGAVKAFDKIVAGSQTLTDAWGRTLEANTAVTERFFDSLAQGNFSGFLSGLQDVIRSAKEAYNAMDALGTHLVFNDVTMAEFEARRRQYRLNIRNGVDVEANKRALVQLQKEEEAYLKTQATRYHDASTAVLGKHIGNADMVGQILPYLKMGESGQTAALARAAELRAMWSTSETATVYNPYTGMQSKEIVKWRDEHMRKVVEALEAYGEMHDDKLKEITALEARAYQAEATYLSKQMEDRESLNYKAPGSGGGGSLRASTFDLSSMIAPSFGMTSSMASLEAERAALVQAMQQATTAEELNAAETALANIQKKIDAQPIALRLNLPEEEIVKIQTQMADLSKNIRNSIKPLDESMVGKGYTEGLNLTVKQVKTMGSHVNETTQAISTMGSALQMINDPGLQAAGLVMGAIASVASSFAMALSKESVNIWTWIAAAIAGTATMVSTIASIKSATAGSFAEGGVIRGSTFIGDAVPVMANAGEVILNAAQQQALASQLQPRSLESERQPYVSGEHLYLGLNNHLRRIGKGEIVTSRR